MYARESELIQASPSRVATPRERPLAQTAHVQAILDLQRLAGNEGVNALLEEEQPSLVREVVGSGGGSPLDQATRRVMEERLGHDFASVRVHTGPRADESARSINAQAYTVGSNVVFRDGGYSPGTEAGHRVLAHELTHVIQQRAGPVAGTPAPGGIRISDPSDPFEQAADMAAKRAVAGPAPTQELGPADNTAVQRQPEEEEEETVQGYAVQRAEEEEEEELPET